MSAHRYLSFTPPLLFRSLPLFRSLKYISHACLDLGLGYTPVMWYAACAWIVALGMRLVGGDCLCMGSRIGMRKLCIMVIKAVRRGVATDYRLTLRRLKHEARRRLKNLSKT